MENNIMLPIGTILEYMGGSNDILHDEWRFIPQEEISRRFPSYLDKQIITTSESGEEIIMYRLIEKIK